MRESRARPQTMLSRNPLPNIPNPQQSAPAANQPKFEIHDPEKLIKPLDVHPKLPKDFEEVKEEVKTKDKQESDGEEDAEGSKQTAKSDPE